MCVYIYVYIYIYIHTFGTNTNTNCPQANGQKIQQAASALQECRSRCVTSRIHYGYGRFVVFGCDCY